VIKLANEGLVYKLLERCRTYREAIAKLTKANTDKDETIDLLTARLAEHEPDLFKNISIGTENRQANQEEKKSCECEEVECKKGEICTEIKASEEENKNINEEKEKDEKEYGKQS